MALDAWDTYERLGSPEGELGLAQLAIWLAIAPKSNAAYMAFNKARATVQQMGTLEVPMHLRNAPTKLMKGLGYGSGYQYDHDAEGGIALDQQCLPDALVDTVFYEPVERGMEAKVREKLDALRAARKAARDGQ
jgi:putative ATPase